MDSHAFYFIAFFTFLCSATGHSKYNFDNVWQNGTLSSEVFRGVTVDDRTNDFYVIGSTSGSFASSSNGGNDIIIGKFDSNNLPVWFVQLGGSGDDQGLSIQFSEDDETILICGYVTADLSTFSDGYSGGGDAFLAKLYATNGSVAWWTNFGSIYLDQATVVRYHQESNMIAVAGFITVAPDNQDIFVAKYSSNGTQLLYALPSTNISEAPAGIALDASGNVFLCGSVNSTFLLAAKVNSAGGLDWSRATPDAVGQLTSMTIDSSGALWAVGFTSSVWSDGIPTAQQNPYFSIIIVKIETTTGIPTWALTLAANGSADAAAYSVDVDDNQNLYVVGMTLGTTFLDQTNTHQATKEVVLLTFDAKDNSVVSSTLSGSSGSDIAYGVAISNNGESGGVAWFVVGSTDGSWTSDSQGQTDFFTLVGTSSSSESSKKLSTAGAIAIGVVVPVFVIATAGLAAFILVRRRRSEPPNKNLHLSTFDTTQSSFKIDYDEIELGSEIGKGAFGVVYRGKWRNSSVAVKQFQQDKVQAKSLQDFLKEANNVSKLRSHRNVCQVYGVCVNPAKPFCIVMEVLSLFKQIASGMSHIHQENILHCDLACRNILVQKKADNKYVVKIADFGLARVVESDQYNAASQASFPVRWSAPEVLSQHKLSKASDVWSFGVVMWEIIEGVKPYYELSTNSEVISYVCQQQKRLPRPAKLNIPDDLYQMMTACWTTEPTSRPSFELIHKKLTDLKNDLAPSKQSSMFETTTSFRKINSDNELYHTNSNISNNTSTESTYNTGNV